MASDNPSNSAATPLKRYTPDQSMPYGIELYTDEHFTALHIKLCPADTETTFSPDDVIDALAPLGIIELDRQAVKDACDSVPMDDPALISSGVQPKHGVPGRIEYKFRTEEETKIQLEEDDYGRVDFRAVNKVRHVSEGDVLAETIPPLPGTPGMDVFGRRVEAQAGTPLTLEARVGSNVRVDDSGTRAIAECDGMVQIENGRILVNSRYQIEGHVDYETGNVKFKGDVIVTGFVREDFRVEATGSVIIGKNIERATVIADQDVIVKGGIIGKKGVRIRAGRNITAAYADNSVLDAEGNITIAKEIVHTVANARKIVLNAGPGAVLGGELHAVDLVKVRSAGDPDSGVRTLVSIDRDREIVEQIEELQDQLAKLQAEYRRIQPIYKRLVEHKKEQGGRALSPVIERDLEKMQVVLNETGGKEKELTSEISTLESQAGMSDTAKIVIKDRIYRGTELSFFDTVKAVSEPMHGGTFMLVKGQIQHVRKH